MIGHNTACAARTPYQNWSVNLKILYIPICIQIEFGRRHLPADKGALPPAHPYPLLPLAGPHPLSLHARAPARPLSRVFISQPLLM